MRRVAVLVSVAVFAGLFASTAGAVLTREISAQNLHFDPHRVIALTGDTVRWTNNDSVGNHTVDPWDLTPFTPGMSTSHVFSSPGTFLYVCTIHPAIMRGTVVVSNLYFTGGATLTYPKAASVSGYAPENTPVDINLVGGTSNPIVTVMSNGEGKFGATIPGLPGQYQAVTASPARTSALIRISVKPKLSVRSRKKNGKYTITVSTSPNQAGGKVVLERKQGSKWKAISTHTLPAASKTAFTVKPAAEMKVRLRLSVPRNGYAKTTSGTLTLRK